MLAHLATVAGLSAFLHADVDVTGPDSDAGRILDRAKSTLSRRGGAARSQRSPATMPNVTVSRRSILTLGGVALASVAAACSRSVHPTAGKTVPATAADLTPSTSLGTTAPPSPGASSRTPPHVGPAVQYTHGPRSRPQVALTFHGAGDPGIARELLAIFAAHRARVTILAVGTWLESQHAIAHDIVDAGHELGNHTYRHLDIDSLSPRGARAEIVRCRDVLVSLTGSPGVHFRQSQSPTATPLVLALAGAAGYPVCLSYDVDSLDYTDPGPSAVRANVATARAGSIVSMHLGHPDTVTAMPHVLSDLADRGLAAVTASALLA